MAPQPNSGRRSVRASVALAAALSAMVWGAPAAQAAPDLRVEFTAKLIPLGTANWQVEAKAKVFNDGDTPAYNVWLALFRDVGGSPNPETDSPVADELIDAVGAATSTEVVLHFGPVQPGPTELTILVDPLNSVPESNEINNSGSISLQVPAKPKAYVNLVSADVQINQIDNEVQYTVWVANAGTKSSGPFTVDLFQGVDPPVIPSWGTPFVFSESLYPGEARPITLPPIWLPDGPHDVWTVVDAPNLVPEIDESDNASGPDGLQVQWIAPAEGPDLFVSQAVAVVNEDGNIVYVADVHNAGTAEAAPPIHVRLYYDRTEAPVLADQPEVALGGEQGYDIIAPIAPGTTTQAVLQWPSPGKVTANSWIVVDAKDAVSESREQNNVFGPIHVDTNGPGGRPDLVVSRIRVDTDGLTSHFHIEVTNVGGVEAPSFDLFVYPDASEFPDPIAANVEEHAFTSGSGLPVGATRTFDWKWDAPAPGTYTGRAWVDPLNGISELSDENNQSEGWEYTVQALPTSDLHAAGFKSTLVGEDVRFSATLYHSGQVNAPATQVALFYDSAVEPEEGAEPSVTIAIDSLAPGESRAISHTWTGPADGTYRSWLVLDWTNAAVETDELNNVLGPVTTKVGTEEILPCPADVLVAGSVAPCLCGGEEVSDGYCCQGVWQIVSCQVVSPGPDAGSSKDSGGQDAFVPVPEADSSDADTSTGDEPSGGGDSGCQQSSNPRAPAFLVGALALCLCFRRRRA